MSSSTIKKKLIEAYDKKPYLYEDDRRKNWKSISIFFDNIKRKSKILEIGAGTLYRTEKVLKGHDVIALDFSFNSLKKIKDAKKVCADACTLPFKDESFDVVTAIAVLHHIPTKKERKDFVDEIYRVLKKKGKALITVWAKKGKSKDTIVKRQGQEYYYYFFKKDEFDNLFTKFSKRNIYFRENNKVSRNYFAEVKK